jgi:myo-inositol-1(or 4)-monophosphatase
MHPELLELATRAAHQAGELLLKRFRGPSSGVGTKSSPTDLVSDADRDAEELIVDLIRKERPEDGLLAEEGSQDGGGSGLRWVVDPLDGTVNFLFGIPVWGVSVAVEDDEGVVVGVVRSPVLDETFSAVRGAGAQLNGAPIKVGSTSELEMALVGTGFAYGREPRRVQAEIVRRVLPRVRDVRRAGSAALDLASLACGRLDGFYEAPLEPWDKAAGLLLISEAGGTISELEGPAGESSGVVAANPLLHDALRRLVEG